MEEIKVFMSYRPAVPFMVTLDCICGGIYRSVDGACMKDNKYLHECDKCGKEIYAYRQYPYTEYQTVGTGPTEWKQVVVSVENEA